ncbi:MAG TPA: RNA polymerase sigma factor [Verrucomicrobiales bacterium]|nr:RNA polymerase sigma factor [Verrucomicrobiae bacterium]MCP5554806.1 RNA polymerase sigma factor [Akkermansiaceae bacterium]HRX54666.1 RNA polymerase sigma factor [Verrucomicrobiales bacterium]
MDDGTEEDAHLMERLAKGEDLALTELMNRWRGRVAGFLQRMVGNHATAMDLTQETFVRLYTSRHRYQPTALFSTYLFHIAANLARTHARWKRRHPTVPLENDSGEMVHEPHDSYPSPADAVALGEKARLVNQAIAELPPELREALLLFSVENLKQADIAKVVGCSTKAVEVRIYRARSLLKETLARQGL